MTKVKGPKNGTIVTASFDGKAKSNFSNLKTTKDLVLLSIQGNEYCTGDYLGAIVQQATTKQEEGKTTFLIADEIYWHNLKGLNPRHDNVQLLKAQALALGDQYFLTNLSHFLAPLALSVDEFIEEHGSKSVDEQIALINLLAKQKNKNFEIIRWKSWVSQGNAEATLKQIIPLYDTVPGLKATLEDNILSFAQRHQSEDEVSMELWKHRSKGYLSEECPAIMWLAATLDYNFIIYPGNIPSSFQSTKNYFIVEEHVDTILNGINIEDKCHHHPHCIHTKNPSRLVNWLDVNFKRSQPKEPRVIEGNGHVFFRQPEGTQQRPANNYDCNSTGNDAIDVASNALLEGIFKAFHNFMMNNNNIPSYGSPTLAEILESITSGILGAELPVHVKLQLVSKLTDKYLTAAVNNPVSIKIHSSV